MFGLSDKPEKRIHQTMAVMEEQKRGEKVVIFSPLSLGGLFPSFLFYRNRLSSLPSYNEKGPRRRMETNGKKIHSRILSPSYLPPSQGGRSKQWVFVHSTNTAIGKKDIPVMFLWHFLVIVLRPD